MDVRRWLEESRAEPEYLASFDSTTCMVRATAAALRGEGFPMLGVAPSVVGRLLPYGNALPHRVRQRLYARGGALEAIDPATLDQVTSEALRAWAVSRYPERGYPAVLVGSPNGAAVHLAAAMGIPWLPQTFLIIVRRDIDPDRPRLDLEWSRTHARPLLAANPDLQLHQLHDPNQDRLMIEHVAYFRVKLRTLGRAYESFLERVLAPGGTIISLECDLEWPTTRIGDRHVFQVGGLGGLEPTEYYEGSDRVAAFLASQGADRSSWDVPQPDGDRPEAEWGFAPALGADLERFATETGRELRRLRFDDAHALSPLVADLVSRRYRERGLPDDRLLVDCFAMQDPWWTRLTGTVPFWLPFNTDPDAAALEAYLDTLPDPPRELDLMLFPNGIESAGQAPIDRWREVLERATDRGAFLGVDPDAYPADYGSYARYHAAIPDQLRHRSPLLPPAPLEALEEQLETADREYAVELL